MMIVPVGVKVHLALGYTDMRKGMDALAALVQGAAEARPFSSHLFASRGKRASILFWDGNGLCLFTNRIDWDGFAWPRMYEPGGTASTGARPSASGGLREWAEQMQLRQ